MQSCRVSVYDYRVRVRTVRARVGVRYGWQLLGGKCPTFDSVCV